MEPINCTPSELDTYLRALAEGCLPMHSSDTGPCSQSKSTPIASRSFTSGSRTVAFRGFPSLRMCSSSTGSRGADSLTSSGGGSHARTYRSQGTAPDSQEPRADSGARWRALLAKYDPSTHSLRTAQRSLFEASTESSVILPRWGTMQNGELSEQTPSAHATPANEYGFSLPTPVATEHRDTARPSVLIPMDRGGRIARRICSTFWKGRSEDPVVCLNPSFAEWMNGFPPEWTACAPLETHKFHAWLLSHGES